MRGLIAKFILLALMTLSFSAFSQEWIEGRRTGEGPGINAGNNVVLHLGLGVEGGYNSNVLRRSEDMTTQNVEGAGRIRISPYLDLGTRSMAERVEDTGVADATPPKVEFSLGVGAYYDHYFSSDSAVSDQNNVGINTHFDLVVLPMRPLSFLADVAYVRTIEPYESTYDQWGSNRIKPGVGLRIRPGGGTLSFEIGYRADLILYEEDEIAERNDNLGNEVRFLTSWKVLPKTMLIQRTRFSPIVYLGDLNSSDATRVNVNSFPVRAELGIQGLFSEKYGLSLFAGYGGSFYQEGDDFDSIIASLEFKFYITPASNLRIGGERDFVDSYYGNFFSKNGGYLSFEQMIANIVLLTLKGDVFYRAYSEYDLGDEDNLDPGETRSELWIGATLFVEARATKWLSFNVSCNYQGNISDYAYLYTNLAGQVDQYPVDFNRVEIMGGARVYY